MASTQYSFERRLAGGRLIKKKKAADGVTVALAAADWRAVF